MKVIPINGVIGYDTTGKSIKQAIAEARGEDIRFEIHSPGGSIFDGIEIFNAIRNYPGKTECHVTGIAASMASYIALAGDKVVVHDNSVYMIHNALTWNYGDQNSMREIADFLEDLSNLVAKAYVKKTGLALAKIKEMMDKETFLYGDEIKENGFADEVVEAENESSKDKNENIVQAKLSIENCFAKLKEEKLDAGEIQKYAAILSSTVNMIDKKVNKETTEEPKMDFKEFLKAHPELASMKLTDLLAHFPNAQAEIEGLKKERFDAGALSVTEKVTKFSNILISDVYPKNVKDTALECMLGKKSEETATEVVAQFDALDEKTKSLLAQKETKDLGNTQGQHTETKSDDAEALVENDREVLGLKKEEVK